MVTAENRKQQWIVSAWIRSPEGVLLLRRAWDFYGVSYGRHLWEPPGGRVHFSEDPIQALHRELCEETGCGLMEAPILAATCDYLVIDGAGQSHRIHVFYEVKRSDPFVPLLSAEHNAFRFARCPQDLEGLDMVPALKNMMTSVLRPSAAPSLHGDEVL